MLSWLFFRVGVCRLRRLCVGVCRLRRLVATLRGNDPIPAERRVRLYESTEFVPLYRYQLRRVQVPAAPCGTAALCRCTGTSCAVWYRGFVPLYKYQLRRVQVPAAPCTGTSCAVWYRGFVPLYRYQLRRVVPRLCAARVLVPVSRRCGLFHFTSIFTPRRSVQQARNGYKFMNEFGTNQAPVLRPGQSSMGILYLIFL